MTPGQRNRQMAEAGYAAYAKTTDGKNFRGEPMPEFDQLPEKQREAWVNAAGAIGSAAEQKVVKLRAALVTLIGTEDRKELEEMEAAIRFQPAPAADKAAMIDAIHSLIEVIESC